MSSRRQNLSLWVENSSPSGNRTARVVEIPDFGSYEIWKENNTSEHNTPKSSGSVKYQKTPSGTLLTFQGSPVSGLAETYEHPQHVPVFLDFDAKTGSVQHIDRTEGQNRLDNSRRKGSLLPDDEYEPIRMTFPARTPDTTPRMPACDLPTVVLTPPPRSTTTSPSRSEGRSTSRPRGPRPPTRVASSAQLRITPAQPSVRQRTKSAAHKPDVFVPPPPMPMPMPPQMSGNTQERTQYVFGGNKWGGVYERTDAESAPQSEIPSDPKGKGKMRSLFKKWN